jgi:hypothetical protein
MFMTEKALMERLKKAILEDALIELDPEKYYILILPESMSLEDSMKTLRKFTDKFNLAVIHADNVKVLEFSR